MNLMGTYLASRSIAMPDAVRQADALRFQAGPHGGQQAGTWALSETGTKEAKKAKSNTTLAGAKYD